jgi:hypothetical protein
LEASSPASWIPPRQNIQCGPQHPPCSNNAEAWPRDLHP